MVVDQPATSDAQFLRPMDWDEGLSHAGLTNMLFMNHFVHRIEVNTYVKNLLVCFHRGCLWLDKPYSVNVELISRIMGLPNEGVDPVSYLAKQDVNLIKRKHSL